MEDESIICKVENNVAQITLNRPKVLNSFNKAMALDFQQVLKEIKKNNDVRAILITGSGRAFCAGQDLPEASPFGDHPPVDISEIVGQSYNPIIRQICSLEKPVICAVNGVAAGAGANIALACDIVIASTAASFVQSFCHIGLIPDSGGTFFLPRIVGIPRAKAMMLLGEKISAEQALEFGMIYKICKPDELNKESTSIAEHLATQPTKGLGLIKRALNQSLTNDLNTQLNVEKELQGTASATDDYFEGVKAFIEKRTPNFKGY